MDAPSTDLARLEQLLKKERDARAFATQIAQDAWQELALSLRTLVRELTETQAFLGNILESSTEYSIIGKDLDRRIVSWNEGARRNYGYTEEEVIGQPSDMLHAPEDLRSDMVERLHSEALLKGKAEGRFLRQRQDGTTFPASVVITRRMDAEGDPVGYVLISRDITVDLEKDRLEQEARDRQREHEAWLQADRVKSEFLANMSHELRTPLNSIIGFAELLESGRCGPIEPNQAGHAQEIAASGRHLLALINDMLDLSKVEAGQMEFYPETTLPSDVVRAVLAEHRADAEAQGVTIHIDGPDEDAPVRLDVTRLRQVTANYLSNAIKFSPKGGTVRISWAHDDGCLRLEVDDQGPGLPAEIQDRLFQPFVQMDQSSSKRHPGTGLGLALTRRVVEAQGGEVGFRPGSVEGTTFWAAIPAGQARRHVRA